MSGESERVAVTAEATWPDDAEAGTEGVVVNWFARVGRTVDEDESLCECQIEKVSFDVPAPTAGELVEIVAEEDAEIRKDDTLAWIRPS